MRHNSALQLAARHTIKERIIRLLRDDPQICPYCLMAELHIDFFTSELLDAPSSKQEDIVKFLLHILQLTLAPANITIEAFKEERSTDEAHPHLHS